MWPEAREFLEARAGRVSERTLASDAWYLARFFAFCEGLALARLKPAHLARYSLWLSQQPGRWSRAQLSSACRYRSVQTARFFLVWAGRQGHTLHDFSTVPLPSKARSLPRVVPVEEARRVLEEPDLDRPTGLRDRLLFEFFYVLGLRRGECHRLHLDDLDLRAGTVRVLGKGGRPRLMPLSPALRPWLEAYLEEGRPRLQPRAGETALWIASHGGQLGYASLAVRLRRYAELHPHALRHACATHLLEGGAPLPYVQKLLGHARLGSTQLYTRVSVGELHREFRRCHPRARFPEDHHAGSLP
ncbi:MAG: tyrosine-type recombinase/integrase [Vulcanimicrobiota bacterium]